VPFAETYGNEIPMEYRDGGFSYGFPTISIGIGTFISKEKVTCILKPFCQIPSSP